MSESESSAVARRHLKHEADLCHATLITADYSEMLDIKVRYEADSIRFANLTRNVGRNFSEWMDREQLTLPQFEGFFRTNSHLLPHIQCPDCEGMKDAKCPDKVCATCGGSGHKAAITSDHARKFISAWRQFPEEVQDFPTAQSVLRQMTFIVVDMMPEQKRLEPQTAAPHTPYKLFLDAVSKGREHLKAWVEKEPMDSWDDEAWLIVKEETKFAAELYAKAEKRLGR